MAKSTIKIKFQYTTSKRKENREERREKRRERREEGRDRRNRQRSTSLAPWLAFPSKITSFPPKIAPLLLPDLTWGRRMDNDSITPEIAL
jgi:hypothetical protein